MRSIKFRAWNGKEMFYPFIARNLRIGKASWSLWEYDTIIATSDYDNNKLMQFTGLQDKDGVDIYEGDIVQYYDCENKEYFKRCVKFDVNYECYIPLGLFNSKIVGNCFENPELIQTKVRGIE